MLFLSGDITEILQVRASQKKYKGVVYSASAGIPEFVSLVIVHQYILGQRQFSWSFPFFRIHERNLKHSRQTFSARDSNVKNQSGTTWIVH